MSTDASSTQHSLVANVRHGLDLFIAVIKKHSFYPEGNAALQQSFRTFGEWLDTFLEGNECLRVTVEKNQLLFQGEVVQEERTGERTIIFPLFRDGIQWLEFLEGVTEDELLELVRILNRYRDLRDDSENDLVTALWEADFSCIRHKAVDKFWEAETLISLTGFKVAGESGATRAIDNAPGGMAGEGAAGAPAGGFDFIAVTDGEGGAEIVRDAGAAGPEADAADGDAVEAPLANPEVQSFMDKLDLAQSASGGEAGPAAGEGTGAEQDILDLGLIWKLTGEEKAALGELIAAEERRDVTSDCLGVLLVLLRERLDASDRAMLQEFIAEGVRQYLARGDFAAARRFVERLLAIKAEGRSEGARVADEIAAALAGVGVLGVLNQMWPSVRAMPGSALEELHNLFLALPSSVVDTLAPMAARAGEPRIKAMLMNAVASHIGRSRADVGHVVGAMPPDLICALIAGYAARGERAPAPLLTKLTRHRDPAVRAAAAKALLEDNPANIKAVFHLLGDRNRKIGRWLLERIGQDRNPEAERLLLGYLAEKSREGESRDEKLILACYRALGRCASCSSIDVLRDILLKRSWRAFFGLERTPHRTGAAIALSLMPAESGARKVLRDAENSRLVGIRRAYAQARSLTRKRKRQADDD